MEPLGLMNIIIAGAVFNSLINNRLEKINKVKGASEF